MKHSPIRQGRRGYGQSTEREPDETFAALSKVADDFERLLVDAVEGDRDAQRIFNQRVLPLVLKLLRGCGLKVEPMQ